MDASGDSPNKLNLRNDILLLFDVDNTIVKPMHSIDPEMDDYLQELREHVSIGLVGGSDITKISKQTLPSGVGSDIDCAKRYDYVFAENGLVAYKDGCLLAKQSLSKHLGEVKLQQFINFCLDYMSKLKIPVKRGNFIEYRNGMLNISPIGRNCSQEEREAFNMYDNEHGIRRAFIKELEEKFGPLSDDPLGLVYSIGGQISFDAFPQGWDKTYCLNLIGQNFKQIHFFGDKTYPGGNDYEIYQDERTIGYSVKDWQNTLEILKSLKFSL